MEVETRCALRVAAVEWQPAPALFALTAVVKATFTLAPGESPLAEVQDEVFDGDSHWDDDEERSLARASDLVPFKARPEVLLVGQAYAPGDRPASSLVARLSVGSFEKSIRVVGDRISSVGAPADPFPFTRMPLRWERAARGPGGMNPVGVRWSDADAPGRAQAPNLLPADAAAGLACFAPIAARWPRRAARMASARAWRPSEWAAAPLPAGLDRAFFNAAPDDQLLAELRGDETIELQNLHPDHPVLVTRLARVRPMAHARLRGGRAAPIVLTPDTLLFDTVRGVASLVYRGQLALDRPRAVERVVVTVAEESRAAPRAGWDIEEEDTQIPTARGAELRDVHRVALGASPEVTLPPSFTSPDVTLSAGFTSPDVTLPPRIPSPDVTLPPGFKEPDVARRHRGGDVEGTALPAWVSAPAKGPVQAPPDAAAALPFRRSEGAQVGGGALGRSMRLGGPRSSDLPPPPAHATGAWAEALTPPARVPFVAAAEASPPPFVPPPIANDLAPPPFLPPPPFVPPPFVNDLAPPPMLGTPPIAHDPASPEGVPSHRPLSERSERFGGGGAPSGAPGGGIHPLPPLVLPPIVHSTASPPIAPPSGKSDPAPPPMLGPLATPAMVAAEMPPPSPDTAAGTHAASTDAADTGPEETTQPAAEELAPLPLAAMTLERCAALRASIDRSPDAAASLLERHEIDAGMWKRLEAHWAEIVQASSKRGKSGPLRDYDAAYLAQIEGERGAITAEEYAQISVAVQRGDAASALADLGIPAAALGRIQRAWIAKTARDAALGAKVRAAIERARQA